jgi:hypothetical protein
MRHDGVLLMLAANGSARSAQRFGASCCWTFRAGRVRFKGLRQTTPAAVARLEFGTGSCCSTNAQRCCSPAVLKKLSQNGNIARMALAPSVAAGNDLGTPAQNRFG